jgi:hypothetical protein
MKLFYLLLTGLFLLSCSWVSAQCPPPGFPDPGNTCPQAPILCENLDGYCATINNNNVTQNFPGCFGPYVLNNDEWFAFYAGSTSITIQVTPSNCTSNGNNQGLQGGIYYGCPPGVDVMDVQCECETDPFILQSNNYIIGEIYWFVLDGCGGDVCDYSIQVLSGSTVGMPPEDPGPITGPTTVCQNSSNNYSIDPPLGATIYNWSLSPAGAGTINGDDETISVNWGSTSGTVELCVDVENECFANPTQSCITIEVQPVPTAELTGMGFQCAGESDPIDLTVTFTGNPDWEFVYSIDGTPQPPIITGENPYTFTVTDPGTYALGKCEQCRRKLSGYGFRQCRH